MVTNLFKNRLARPECLNSASTTYYEEGKVIGVQNKRGRWRVLRKPIFSRVIKRESDFNSWYSIRVEYPSFSGTYQNGIRQARLESKISIADPIKFFEGVNIAYELRGRNGHGHDYGDIGCFLDESVDNAILSSETEIFDEKSKGSSHITSLVYNEFSRFGIFPVTMKLHLIEPLQPVAIRSFSETSEGANLEGLIDSLKGRGFTNEQIKDILETMKGKGINLNVNIKK